jgi:hypothetical protein
LQHTTADIIKTVSKTNKISYKVFIFKRVKKKLRFFDTDTYPLLIRLTAGVRTLYVKSKFFMQVQQNKYQQEVFYNKTKICINDIIVWEENLMKYLLAKERDYVSLDTIRQEYSFFSRDILHELDERFKKFMVDFFYAENLPAYSLFIKNDGSNYTSEFILRNLERSLQAAVFDKLLKTAVQKAPPYIPFITFFRQTINNPLPLFPVYQWQEQPLKNDFTLFIETHFPEYKSNNPVAYINSFISEQHVQLIP